MRFFFFPRLWFLNRRRSAKKAFPVVILFGHIVADRPKYMGIPSDLFLRQIKYVKKHYKIASLSDAIDMINEMKVPAPTVVLTFDDGYQDNHLGLRTVLDSEDIPSALFVCTNNVEEARPFDHDMQFGESDFFPLTWDQIKDFERLGTTIGSHTRTHFDCGSTDERMLRKEIVGSLEELRHRLGHDVPYFAFPWGHPENISSVALAIASENYPYLFTAFGGINQVQDRGSHVFKRISWPQSLLELEACAAGDFGIRKRTKSHRTWTRSLASGAKVAVEPYDNCKPVERGHSFSTGRCWLTWFDDYLIWLDRVRSELGAGLRRIPENHAQEKEAPTNFCRRLRTKWDDLDWRHPWHVLRLHSSFRADAARVRAPNPALGATLRFSWPISARRWFLPGLGRLFRRPANGENIKLVDEAGSAPKAQPSRPLAAHRSNRLPTG